MSESRPADDNRDASSGDRVYPGRRLWPLLVVGVVLLVVFLYSRHGPVDVEAEYNLTGVRKNVVALHARWEADGGKTVDATFNYRERSVPRIQNQSLELPPDRYEVTLTLERADGTSRMFEREVEIERAGTVSVNLD